MVQTCIVHLIRSSMAFVSRKDRKQIMPDLKAICRADNAGAALDRLAGFEDRWGARCPAVGQSWRWAWEHVVPTFAFPPDVRRMIYTTNAVESLNRSLRKIIRTRGSFPNDEAAIKLLYLAIQNAGITGDGPLNEPPQGASLPSCSATASRSQLAESVIIDPPCRLHRFSDTPRQAACPAEARDQVNLTDEDSRIMPMAAVASDRPSMPGCRGDRLDAGGDRRCSAVANAGSRPCRRWSRWTGCPRRSARPGYCLQTAAASAPPKSRLAPGLGSHR
jgi:hypothetical protein